MIIELAKTKSPNGKKYTTVTAIMYDDPEPLHKDPKIAKVWLEDDTTWQDVYSKKPVEYLEAIARGETPKWDNDKGGYVYGDSSVGETSMGGSKSNYSDPQEDADVDGDLPF